ncbi:hypothetical protein JKP88DRAFT_235494 [Tribonema minus]|uniref:SP-RING-type domain-containing protein n=1 Tax=Tribonema minus TaxID=303371 RepID=A0A835Z6R0_9STRA|nr:hypothetical protein JKP88DRAFT_235494 [Tribonema minus]
MFEEEMAKATDAAAGVDPKQHNMYKDVMKIVGEEEEEGGDSDDDVAIDRTRGEVNLKCSFTGTLFVDPVKSRVCGHTFSKAILGYIRSKGHAAVCPMGGCNQPMRADDMEPDHAMEIKVQRHRQVEEQTQRERQQRSQDDGSDDDDHEGETYYRV